MPPKNYFESLGINSNNNSNPNPNSNKKTKVNLARANSRNSVNSRSKSKVNLARANSRNSTKVNSARANSSKSVKSRNQTNVTSQKKVNPQSQPARTNSKQPTHTQPARKNSKQPTHTQPARKNSKQPTQSYRAHPTQPARTNSKQPTHTQSYRAHPTQPVRVNSRNPAHTQSYREQSHRAPRNQPGLDDDNILTILDKYFGLIANKWCELKYGFYSKTNKGDYILYLGNQFDNAGNMEKYITDIHITDKNNYICIANNINESDYNLDYNNHLHLQYGYGDEKIGIVTQKYVNTENKVQHICIYNDIYNNLNSIFLIEDANLSNEIIYDITNIIYNRSGYNSFQKMYHRHLYNHKVLFINFLNKQLSSNPKTYIKDFDCTNAQNLKSRPSIQSASNNLISGFEQLSL